MNRASAMLCSLLLAGSGLGSVPAGRGSITIPFDFSRGAIALDVTIAGTPLFVLLDTGVDPSLIDLARATQFGLKVDRKNGGDASGFGDGKGAAVFPSSIEQLVIAGHAFAPFDALATDLTAFSDHYGRKLDAVLGYRFLSGKIVLIDYAGQKLSLLSQASDAAPLAASCRTRWTTPMRTSDSFPVISSFRFGKTRAPVTLDTGSNSGIALYQSALTIPGMQAALAEQGAATFGGFRGDSKVNTYALDEPVGFGPFTLASSTKVTVRKEKGSQQTAVANIGNALFAAMKLKMLLDYRHRSMTFYGNCS